MKNPIRSIVLGIALLGLASTVMAQSTLTYNANPTIGTTNTTFTFNLFDSNLGTLTAVDLLLTSSTAAGSVSVDTNSSGVSAEFTNLAASIRTSGTGLSNQFSPGVNLTLSPGLPYTVPEDDSQVFSVTGSQSLISSTQTYGINPANWSSYEVAGGSGNTPDFTGRAFTSFSITSFSQPATSNTLFTAPSNYTLRYTYTPSGPVPIPEPGQVAASLLLLGGIGTYVFLKRRKKSATTVA
jgi:hypothetical protein